MRLGIVIIIITLVAIVLVSADFHPDNASTKLIKNEDSNIHKDESEFIAVFTIMIVLTASLIINKLQERQKKK